MLQHNWLIQDLVDVFGGRQQVGWLTFHELLLKRIKTPWLTQWGCKEIFTQLSVGGGRDPMEGVVRVADLVEALLDFGTFTEEAARRCIRVIFHEAHHGRLNMKNKCLEKDAKRTGLLDLKQLRAVLNDVEQVRQPGVKFAEGDAAVLYRRFSLTVVGSGFQYDRFLEALALERRAFFEHLIVRALPCLQDQAQTFEERACEHDAGRAGELTLAQLVSVLRGLELGLTEQADEGLTELSDFAELLFAAVGQAGQERFKCNKVVKQNNNLTIYYYLSLLIVIIIYYCLPPFVILHHYSSLLLIIIDYFLLFITIYNYLLLFIIIYHCLYH